MLASHACQRLLLAVCCIACTCAHPLHSCQQPAYPAAAASSCCCPQTGTCDETSPPPNTHLTHLHLTHPPRSSPQSGGAYVPLDPSYQSDRLSGYLADAATPVLITQSALATKARDLAAAAAAETGRAPPTIILMEDIMDSAASGGSKKKPAAPAIQLSDRDLAYCMFTSGSTVGG